MKPLCIDLFCGLGGWAQGFLAEGFEVIGLDIERHDYGTGGYPGQLVLQDALTLHGSQFRDASCIVASPPCQEYSYMAMPWSRAKAKAAAIRADETGESRRKLTALFDCCFRLQREAIAATGHSRTCPECDGEAVTCGNCRCEACDGKGYVWVRTRHIPMVVENVRGAQSWVGRAPWNYGSFYLWGDVPALMPFTWRATKNAHVGSGSWFPISHGQDNGQTYGAIPNRGTAIGEGRKVPGMNFHDHEKTGKPGRSFQSAAVDSVKVPGLASGKFPGGGLAQGYIDGIKQAGISGARSNGRGSQWFQDGAASVGSRSHARKAASAQIAKIPFELAAHIARCFKPVQKEQVA